MKQRIKLKNNKTIGFLDEKRGLFIKKVRKSKHLFRKLDAWGIDYEYFSDILLPNNFKIRIVDLDDMMIYEILASEMKKQGIILQFGDYGKQIFLPRNKFEKWSIKDFELKELATKVGL